MISLIDFAEVEAAHKACLIMALHNYEKYYVDFPDAYLAALAEFKRLSIVTFNNTD